MNTLARIAVLLVVALSSPKLVSAQTEAAPPVAVADPSGAVTISALVREALETNPDLTAMRRDADAARARIPQEKALPDPMLSFGNMTQHYPLPFSGLEGDFSETYVGFSQALPWFGVRRLRGQAAASDAEAALEAYNARVRELAAEVKIAGIELYSLDRRIAVVERDMDILEKFARIADARYAVGKAMQVDGINARLEITELLDRKGALETERAAAESMINTLLHRDPETPIFAVARPVTAADFPSLDQLVALSRQNAPQLAERRRAIDAANHRLRLAEREAKYPEVNFEFTYHNRPAFEDYYSYGVTLTLPFWSASKQRYQIAERTADLAAAESRLSWQEAQVRNRLRDAHVRATTAARLLKLHEQGLIPQSVLALESAMSAYQTGGVDFQTLLAALRKALDYETHYYELVTQYATALAAIEAETSLDLTR